MKTCEFKGCNHPVFSHLYCKYHQFVRYMKKGDLWKPKPRKSSIIPKESKKRKEEKKYYSKHLKDLEKEIREQNEGKVYCFFTGKEITGQVSFHHLRGRTGDYYLDKKYLVPSINEYHLQFHFESVGFLLKQAWYSDFMERLKIRDDLSWKRQKNKENKNLNLDFTEI